jgi:uncharacterized linocin/CFP29 family protein
MDVLKRDLAPLTDLAWEHIEHEARRILAARLSARRFVTAPEPRGFDLASVNLGALSTIEPVPGMEALQFGIRRVLPLIEARAPFVLEIDTLDALSRGAPEADLEPLVKACQELAAFEERVVFQGFAPAGVVGILGAKTHQPVPLGEDASQYPAAVARAMVDLMNGGMTGPFTLVLGDAPYRLLVSELAPTPPRDRISKMIGGAILRSPAVEHGVLVDPGDDAFALTIGQDASIGYAAHDRERVHLYLLETLTFQMHKPEAVVLLQGAT